jgi:hypothetical protein
MKIAFVVAALFAVPAFAGNCPGQSGSSQLQNSHVAGAGELPDLLSMGPDPGGHTGATVTPETTKTGQPAVDGARQSASGGRTENSGPAVSDPPQPKKQGADKP